MEEEEPDFGFSLTVAPSLVQAIAGRGGGHAAIIAKTPRDQAIIDGVRREEREKTGELVKRLEYERRMAVSSTETEETERLDARLTGLLRALPAAESQKGPGARVRCAEQRLACGECYSSTSGDFRACAAPVEEFVQCVRTANSD